MAATGSSPLADRRFRFGPFELNERDGELRKHGIRVKLQEQPFRVLLELVTNGGKVVSREELQQKLWSEDTFVDFDTGLNTAIRKLRAALNDDADQPRYIETLAKRGYRFIAPVSQSSAVNLPAGPNSVEQLAPGYAVATEAASPQLMHFGSASPLPRKSRWYWALAAAAALALAVYGVVLWVPRLRKPPLATEQRVTSNPPEAPVVGAAISPDGKYVAYADTTGLYVRLLDTGETRLLALPKGMQAIPTDWFPDSTHLLLGSGQTQVGDGHLVSQDPPALWKISLLGGEPQKLADNAVGGKVSPDGSRIAFVRGNNDGIWLMGSDGTDARRVGAPTNPDDYRAGVAWSPHGDRIAYLRNLPTKNWQQFAIETLDLGSGASKLALLSDQSLWALCWAPDGRLLYASEDNISNERGDMGIWAIRVNEKTGARAGEPVQISNGLGHVGALSMTADGKRLVLWRDNVHVTVFVSEFDSSDGKLKPPRRLTLDQNSNYATTWSPDSHAVLFGSNRNGSFKLFRQNIDQSVAEMLAEGRGIFQPRLSPDGTEILYLAGYTTPDGTQPVRLMAVPVTGGAPRDVLQLPRIADIQCARNPSTLCLIATFLPEEHVFSFDPKTGKLQLFSRLDGIKWTHWGLAPDGSHIAFATINGDHRKVTFLNLSDGSKREIEVGTRPILGLDWVADSTGVYLVTRSSDGSSVLEKLAPNGERKNLLSPEFTAWYTYAIAAPDGHHVALSVQTGENNVWMLENF